MPNGVRFVGVGFGTAISPALPQGLVANRRCQDRVGWLCGLRSAL
jgi:hypothetical protein